MGQTDDLANGVQLALDATLAQLGQEPDRLVELLNASTPPELAHAVAYLSERFQELLVSSADGDRQHAADAFRRSIAQASESDELRAGHLPHDESEARNA